LTPCKIFINYVGIIVCKVELFKNPIIDLINQEISAERIWNMEYGTPVCNERNRKT
jgi:hypothetical protein